MASITSFLPSSDDNKGEYSGIVRGPGAPSFLTSLQEVELRRKQTEAQVRDAENRRVVFDADPSPDAEITSEVIDPELPLGVMNDEGNIITDPTDAGMAAGEPEQSPMFKERVIDVGHVEKCVADVRELVSDLCRSYSVAVTLFQALSSHEIGIERTQVLSSTQQASDGESEGGSGVVSMTQASALAGISHGVETQVLENMFGSLPPSSQVVGSEILGLFAFPITVDGDLTDDTDLETQQQSRPGGESFGSFTADESMEVDPVVPDRGLK